MLPRTNAMTSAAGCEEDYDGPGLVWRVRKASLRGPFSGASENGPEYLSLMGKRRGWAFQRGRSAAWDGLGSEGPGWLRN